MGLGPQHRRKGPQAHSQRGVGLLSALLGLVVAAIVTAGVIQGKVTEAQQSAGRLQADLLLQVQEAVNTYTLENYPALQSNLAVTKNGVTLATGSTDGQSLAPTVANLIAMGYLSANTNTTAYLGGNYVVRLRQEPTGCAGVACNIPGMVYIDQPIVRKGSTEMDAITVGSLMRRLGGDAMATLNTNAAQLTAVNGANVANPLAGNPVGVVGAQAGFGTSGFGRFLTLNDPRDPNFQGNLTVAGNIRSITGSVGTGSGFSAAALTCRLGEILNSGQIISRTSACITRAFMDGNTGQVGVADTNGNTNILLDGTSGKVTGRDNLGNLGFELRGNGRFISYDAMGQQRTNIALVGPTTGAVMSDIFMNNSGTAKIDQFGTVTMANATLNAFNTLGQACSNEGGMSWATSGGRFVLIRCTSNVWSSIGGLPTATQGLGCTPNGAAAMSSAGAQLICNNGTWADLMDRMGRYTLAASYLVQHGTNVPKPPCASGSTGSVIYLIPQNDTQAVQYVNRFATDNGASWSVSITTGTGPALTNDYLVAQTYCAY